MTYGFIIAAGNQRRFKDTVPKCLQLYRGKPILEYTFSNLQCVCDKVFVVCSNQNKRHFDLVSDNVIAITSGAGCGDAVYRALSSIEYNPLEDMCIIQWGDTLADKNLYQEMISKYTGGVVIPCEYVANPYVEIVGNENSFEVKFSRWDIVNKQGYHDLSVFYGNIQDIINYSKEFIDKFGIEDTYIHPHNNEFQFLDLFNYTSLKLSRYLSEYRSYSFNTVEELMSLQKMEGIDI